VSADDLTMQLLQQLEEVRAQLRRAKKERDLARKDHSTGLLHEPRLIEHLDAVLYPKIIQSSGARRMLGRRTSGTAPTFDQLAIDLRDELRLAVIFIAITYPNPPLESEEIFQEALRSLGQDLVMLTLTDDRRTDAQLDGSTTELPCHFAGRSGRHIASCFADTPATRAFATMRTVSEGLRQSSLAKALGAEPYSHGEHFRLAFRADDGGALLSEALNAMQVWQKHFEKLLRDPEAQLPENPAQKVELARKILLGIARTRAEHSQRMASLAMQVRLKANQRLYRKLFASCSPMINMGKDVGPTGFMQSILADASTQASFDGPKGIDGEALKIFLSTEVAPELIKHDIQAVELQLHDLDTGAPNELQLQRLILLAAHNQLSRF